MDAMRWAIVAGVGCVCALVAGQAFARTDYVVRWTVVEHDITPVLQTVRQNYVVKFSDDAGKFLTDEDGEQAMTLVGQQASFTTKLGTQHFISYTAYGRSIIRTDMFPGFSFVLTATNGERGCSARVTYRKSPGKPFFESKRYDGSGPSKASRVEAADVSCEVLSGPPIS